MKTTTEQSGKVIWLASYPKSGNTWYRAFLTALFSEGKIHINDLATDGIFSSRLFFNCYTDIESTDLYDWEVKSMISDVFQFAFKNLDELKMIKVHDAYAYNVKGNPIIPGEITKAAIYFIRNPLDVAGSFANHLDSNMQHAIDLMNSADGGLAIQSGNLNLNNQFHQHMSTWSRHVKSWLSVRDFPVHIVRYEDMLNFPFETFRESVEFAGLKYSDDAIRRAIEASSFDKLRNQEQEKGFNEKLKSNNSFFRKGTKDNWKVELTELEIELIKKEHGNTMRLFKYI